MTMGMTILKGLLIGICASAPLGPVGILVLQKSLCHGFKNGFVTGLGAALTDAIYAIIAIFFLSITQDFLEKNQIFFLIVGGIVVLALGISMALKNPFRKVKVLSEEEAAAGRRKFSFTGFFQSIAICITNPGAILIMFSLFTAFRVDAAPGDPFIIHDPLQHLEQAHQAADLRPHEPGLRPAAGPNGHRPHRLGHY